MLYIIYGDNISARYKARNELGKVDLILNLENENIIAEIKSSINNQSLWGETQIITLDKVLEDKDVREFIYSEIENIKNSDNKFIIEEIDISKASLDKLKKSATKVYDCTANQYANNRGNNLVPEKSPFALCDYIAARDRRRAWVELMRLYETDVESEPLHGALWWKVKNILITKGAGWGDLAYDLIMISARAHNGECDFRNEIEKWVLSI
mgnify:CR=1 FL=1